MKFNKIYANGCSFTCAGGLNWPECQKIYKNYLNIDIINHMDFAYPNILSKKLGVDIINESVCGGSINRMVRTTYQYIFKNKNDLKNTLFILEVPPSWRDEFYSNILNRTINITPNSINNKNDRTDVANGYDINDMDKIYKQIKEYFFNFVDIDYDMFKFTTNLFGLLSYIKMNNWNYLLLDCGTFNNFIKHNNLDNDYNYVWIEGMPLCEWISLKDISIKHETNGKFIDGHSGIYGNHKIAEHLYYIVTNEKKII